MKIHRLMTLVLTCGLAAACQDLTVDDVNRPSLEESLSTVSNVETSVGSAVKYWLGGQVIDYGIRQDQCCAGTYAPAIAGLSDEMTFGIRSVDIAPTTVLDEPRTEVDHHDAGFWPNRLPYQEGYTSLAMCHDILSKIAGGFTWANVERTKWTCQLTMGFSTLYFGVMFDKALTVEDDGKPIDVKRTDFVAHDVLIDLAKKQIRTGIQTAIAAPFASQPTTWVNGIAYNNVDYAKLGYSYLARAEVWKAATPEQREDISKGGVVDWNKVIQYVDSGITSTWTTPAAGAAGATFTGGAGTNIGGGFSGPAFVFKGDQVISGTVNDYLINLMRSSANNTWRQHFKMLGPGDTTGAWANYLATPINSRKDTVFASPDKRFPQKAGARHVTTTTNVTYIENAVTQDGKYFQLLASSLAMTANSSPAPDYRKSSYQFIRFGDTPAAQRSTNCARSVACNGMMPIMTKEEMSLLKAEAYMRLGNPAAALPLINAIRTDATKGALPAAGLTGPTQPFPQCVPHSWTDANKCGDLMDALLWEKKLEALGTDPFVNWADWRAFGLLEPGSLVYWSPHSRELETLGLPYYTYGPGIPGSADAPPCPTGSTSFKDIGCTNYKSKVRLPKPTG